MTDQAVDVKRRFDDVYRTLMVIGPVLSFAFGNYATSSVFMKFVFNFGYPALMTSILIWGVAHLLGHKWEYHAKLIGYVTIWFTFLVLASIVYVQGAPIGSIWYQAAAGMTILISFFSARAMARANIVSRGYEAAMVILAFVLAVVAPLVVN
jgi:hypothetical protein